MWYLDVTEDADTGETFVDPMAGGAEYVEEGTDDQGGSLEDSE